MIINSGLVALALLASADAFPLLKLRRAEVAAVANSANTPWIYPPMEETVTVYGTDCHLQNHFTSSITYPMVNVDGSDNPKTVTVGSDNSASSFSASASASASALSSSSASPPATSSASAIPSVSTTVTSASASSSASASASASDSSVTSSASLTSSSASSSASGSHTQAAPQPGRSVVPTTSDDAKSQNRTS